MSEEDPGTEDPDQQDDHLAELLAEFFERLREDAGVYATRIMQTLELNKVEARHQRPELPPVFARRIDDLGMVQSYSVSEAFAGRIGELKNSFSVDEINAFLARIDRDEDFLFEFAVMLHFGRLTYELQELGDEDRVDRTAKLYAVYSQDGVISEVLPRQPARLVKNGRRTKRS